MAFLTEKTVSRFIVLALILGTAYRMFPVLAGEPALSQFFMTEDGYLMLTIARNMAIGLGMSVSDGTIPSNGVQPLATFLFSLPYLLTGGDKVASLAGVQLISVAISVAGIFSVRALARDILAPQNNTPLWPWLVATLWFVGPILVLHTMNGLETGLYMLMVALTLVIFGRLLNKGTAGFGDRIILGGASGLTFLVRNDGVFLVVAIFIVWFLHELMVRRDSLRAVVVRLFPPGFLSLIIAAPWLINNYVNFGSIVPISGTAQALSGGLAINATLLPAKLFEYTFPMLPVPNALETNPAFMAVSVVIVAVVVLVFVIGSWQQNGAARYIVAAYTIFAVSITAYYGFYFGAGWFLSRYLAPLAAFLITAATYVAIRLVFWVARGHSTRLLSGIGVGAISVSVVLLGWMAVPGVREQGHFQVVGWVEQNVPRTAWVGAVQTGTVGYWHDRTINLDGKVNPDALKILLEDGHILNYVLNSQIEYLADWSGLVGWVDMTTEEINKFSDYFEVLANDQENNLGVLRRR